MFSRRQFVAALFAAVAVLNVSPSVAQKKVTVFAAASLKNALDAVNASWQADTGKVAVISYAASSALARQIEEGAPADLFISADLDWMKYLSDKNLTRKATEIRLLGNRLVLIAAKDSTLVANGIGKDLPLAKLLGDGRLAMGEVKAVPAGKYGREALEKLGLWSSVEGKIAQAENVRAALKFVAAGEAPLGIVYATDAISDPTVKVIGTFPADSHAPILYPASLTAKANQASADFLTYMQTAKAKVLFETQGFTALVPVASN